VGKLSNLAISESFFDKFALRRLDIYSLLFQTGYLTIKRINWEADCYYLSYPNEEVRVSFLNNLLEAYSYQVQGETGSLIFQLEDSLSEGNVELFIDGLRSLHASIPCQIFAADP